jgi:PHD/YefM family antitoxin component YafN of YafNO toxin-antitoxin module
MATTTVSIEELRQVADEVGEAADNGPVYVTRPGKSPLVLLTANEYRKLSGTSPTILDLLAYPGAGQIEFDPPRMGTEPYRPIDDLFD